MAYNAAQIETYENLIGSADATNCSDAEAAARTVINTLRGYHSKNKFYHADLQRLESAMIAYARLLQKADVKS